MKYKIQMVGLFKWRIVGIEYKVNFEGRDYLYKPSTIPIIFGSYLSSNEYLSQL